MFKLRTTGWALVHQLIGADFAGVTIFSVHQVKLGYVSEKSNKYKCIQYDRTEKSRALMRTDKWV
jgi:hypothetical protein